MILSLAVLLLPIGAVFLFWAVFAGGNQPTVIDPKPAYNTASHAGLDVREPQGLSEDWKPVSSNASEESDAMTLRVGFQTPEEAGIQLVETEATPQELMSSELNDDAKFFEKLSLDSGEWRHYGTPGGNALVYSEDGLTILVHGEAEAAELIEFAGSLA